MTRTRTKTTRTKTANGTTVVKRTLVEASELEWKIQAAAVRRLKAMPEFDRTFTLAGDMNSARRGRGEAVKAKATGIAAGDPDLRVYLAGGWLGLIEYKSKDGRLSDDQKIRHPLLRSLGFTVEVIKTGSPDEAADMTEAVVRGWLTRRWMVANDNGRMAA